MQHAVAVFFAKAVREWQLTGIAIATLEK